MKPVCRPPLKCLRIANPVKYPAEPGPSEGRYFKSVALKEVTLVAFSPSELYITRRALVAPSGMSLAFWALDLRRFDESDAVAGRTVQRVGVAF